MNSNPAISSYDLVPYESYPFAHLHPARMAATAQLRGMKPPPVATARVLDLGCGSGGHVIALAGFYPQMQLVGTDLAAGQIELGNQRIRELGLTNVSLHAGNLGEGLPGSAIEAAKAFGGQFDYIVCQGVYYVVPDTVRSAIWQVLRQHLAPSGMAHISFNTYPGWKQREVAQDFAQFHAVGTGLPAGAAQEQAVREGLGHISAMAPKHTEGLTAGYGHSLQAEANAAARAVPGLLFHEFLSGDNRPLYFRDMLVQAEQAGFAYLCETSLPDAWPGRLGTAAQNLMSMAGGDALRLEQYIDFVTARTYRNSMWVRPAVAHALPSSLQDWPVQALHGLHLAADLRLGEAAAPGQQAFVNANGLGFSVTLQHAAALQALLGGQDAALWHPADDLLTAFPDSVNLLQECVLRGLLSAWREPPDLTPLKPFLAPAWLRQEALRPSSAYLPSAMHQPLGLDVKHRALLAQLDGSQAAELLAARPDVQPQILYFKRLGWLRT
jgi:SAM-dependent methyltransferase